MCIMADEIQSIWEPFPGDRFYLPRPLFLSGDKLTIYKTKKKVYNSGLYFFGCGDNLLDKFVISYKGVFSYHIPNQEDIQNLLLKKIQDYSTVRELFTDFVQFVFKEKQILRYDLTSLWLMFYYFRCYNKEWNGDDWVKEE